MNYNKIRSFSGCIDKKELYFYTILGDLLSLDLKSKKLRVVRNTEKIKKIPFVFQIFKIDTDFYHINNYENAVIDEEDNNVVLLKESNKELSFFYFAHEYDGLIYLMEGDGKFYKKINVKKGTYEFDKIAEEIIFACSLVNECIWITSDGKVVSYSYVDGNKKMVIQSECMVDVVAITSDDKGKYYFLHKSGEIISLSRENKELTVNCKLSESGSNYGEVHYYNEKLIFLPEKNSTMVKWIEMNDMKCHIVEYPEDSIFFKEQPLMFARYAENEDILIYPLRGLNYFLVIDKNNGKIGWMKPVNIHETLIEVKDNDRIKKMGAPFREGILLLEEFIEGIL